MNVFPIFMGKEGQLDKEAVLAKIYSAFGGNPYPGDPFLQGSFEGDEPYEEVGAFVGKKDWRSIPLEFLDAHYSAISFFSEAGFRFYLPAYLVADLNDRLNTADPVFHLTHDFFEGIMEIDINSRKFLLKPDKSTFVNPRRYGAMTVYDYALRRLSVFTREEAQAIVSYLEYKRDTSDMPLDKPRIESALGTFWRDRARSAPTAEDLKKYLDDQASQSS